MKMQQGVWIPPNWFETIDHLSDASAATLIRTALAFVNGEDREIADPVVAALWPILRGLLERQIDKSTELSEKRRAAIRARWDKAANTPAPEDAPAPRTVVKLHPAPGAKPTPAVKLRVAEVQLREAIGNYYHRRPSTPWSRRESQLAAQVAKRPEVAAETAEILSFYNSGYKFQRHDVATLLNNWQGELDRARTASALVKYDGSEAITKAW